MAALAAAVRAAAPEATTQPLLPEHWERCCRAGTAAGVRGSGAKAGVTAPIRIIREADRSPPTSPARRAVTATGTTPYGGAGGGGALGVRASGNLTINNAKITGGDGGASPGGNAGTSGNGGGGAGMAVTGPATINVASSSRITGGSTAGMSGRGDADGGGGVGVYFAGSPTGVNSLTNAGLLAGADSAGGGGGTALVLTDGITVNNNGGTVSGGDSNSGSKGQKGAGAPGVLIRGDNNTVNHTVANSVIQGGESSDGSKTPPGILVQGNANTIITASTIVGGADLENKSQGNAIEFVGYKNTLEIQSGYDFDKGNVLYKEPRGGILALGGSTNVSAFDLSSIGALGSGARFQGFFACEKRGASTWVVSGAPSGLGRYNVAEGILRLTGSGDLSPVERVLIGSSGVLDISGVTTIGTTLPNLYTDEGSQILLGNKALALLSGGNLEGAIVGNSGITLSGALAFNLLSTCKVSAGPVAVERSVRVYSYGATVIGNISVTDGAYVSLIEASIFVGNVTIGTNGNLQVVTEASEQPGIIKGNLDFQGGASTQLDYDLGLFPGASDLWMLEVTGNVNLTNVPINFSFTPPAIPARTDSFTLVAASRARLPVGMFRRAGHYKRTAIASRLSCRSVRL
jgi:hypothetical protein